MCIRTTSLLCIGLLLPLSVQAWSTGGGGSSSNRRGFLQKAAVAVGTASIGLNEVIGVENAQAATSVYQPSPGSLAGQVRARVCLLSCLSSFFFLLSIHPSIHPSICLCIYTHTHTHTHTHTELAQCNQQACHAGREVHASKRKDTVLSILVKVSVQRRGGTDW